MQKQADAILPLKEISKSPAVLELKAVTKVFPGVKALSEVSLKLIPGEVTALVGENGAGKSTVVKILTGIYQPDDGIILVDGQPTIFPVPQAASQSGVRRAGAVAREDGAASPFGAHGVLYRKFGAHRDHHHSRLIPVSRLQQRHETSFR